MHLCNPKVESMIVQRLTPTGDSPTNTPSKVRVRRYGRVGRPRSTDDAGDLQEPKTLSVTPINAGLSATHAHSTGNVPRTRMPVPSVPAPSPPDHSPLKRSNTTHRYSQPTRFSPASSPSPSRRTTLATTSGSAPPGTTHSDQSGKSKKRLSVSTNSSKTRRSPTTLSSTPSPVVPSALFVSPRSPPPTTPPPTTPI